MHDFVHPSRPIMMEYSTMLFQRDIHDIRTYIIALGVIPSGADVRYIPLDQHGAILHHDWTGRTDKLIYWSGTCQHRSKKERGKKSKKENV